MATKKIELKDSGVIFNAEDHSYLLGEKYLSGITEMLQRQLFPNEYDGIPISIIKKAGEYGTSVHQSCEAFDSRWENDQSVEVQDYIRICSENNLIHEFSEYTVSDGKDWASNVDKVYRENENTFNLGDIKTYGVLSPDKLEKARWQLSIYAYMFELQNPKAKVGKLFIIRLRNKQKKDGSFDHVSEIVFVERIPSEICKELLDADLRGEQFSNPYSIPENIKSQEEHIRELILTKEAVENELNQIKSSILAEMEAKEVRTWMTGKMRLTRKLPTTRTAFNLSLFKEDHPEYDYALYEKTTQVSGSLTIAI